MDGTADWAVLRDTEDPASILFLLLDVPTDLTVGDLTSLLSALGLRGLIQEFTTQVCRPGVTRLGASQAHLRTQYPWIFFGHVHEPSVWKEFLRGTFGV